MLTALRSRVILVLIAAALPAALAVYVLASRNFEMTRVAAVADLRQDADLLLSRIDSSPLAAMRLATTLAAAANWDPTFESRCSDRIERVLTQYRGFDGLAIFRDGRLLCLTTRAQAPPARDALESALAGADLSPRYGYAGLVRDGAGRIRIFGAARADPAGGLVAMTFVDPTVLNDALAAFGRSGDIHAAIIGPNGEMVASAGDSGLAAQWPRAELPTQAGVQRVRDATLAGDRWMTAAAKMTDIDAWLISGFAEKTRLADAWRQFAGTIAGPALMIIATCLGIWLGLNRLVLQWERRLRQATRAYTQGNAAARVGAVRGAPREFAELAGDFDALADRVNERTGELEREISRRNSYIRELHHRVKNNLQVISSLLALQRRGLKREQQSIIRFPEMRVNAIAAAFQLGYRQDDAGAVEVKELILEVCHRLRSDAGDPDALSISVEGADVVLKLDDAISLAMTVAELLADRLVNRPAYAPPTEFEAKVEADKLHLSLRDPAAGDSRASSLSSRLLVTYAAQLRAVINQEAPGAIALDVPLTPIRVIA